MKRTFGALALGALLLALGACSSTSTSTTNTTAAPGTTAASSSGSTTAKTNDTKATTGTGKTQVTKPTKVEKIEKSKLPTKAQSVDRLSGLTTDEQECIDYVVYETVTADPTIAENDLTLAGVVGGSIVACVPQEKLAVGLTEDIKTSTSAGASLTAEQEACLTASFNKTSSDSLAVIIGALAIQEPTILTQAATELDAACGTNIAG